MKPEAILIHRPDVDFSTFLGVALKVLGHSLASAADASGRQLTDAERFLSCLSAMHDPNASANLNPKLLPHVAYSVLIVATEPDVLDIVECSGGMPFVRAETVMRGVLMIVLSGTLAQWKAAVLAGSTPETEPTVRAAYNRIHGLFRDEGINLWTDFQQRPAADRVTFLLEDKRGR
jgi:hypothetical protein